MSDVAKGTQRGLITLLFFTPLFFGTVEFWSLAAMEIFSFFLLFSWLFPVFRAGGARLSVVRAPLLIPITVLLGLAVLQIVPIPPVLLKAMSSHTYQVYRDAFPAERDLPWLTLSLYPYATLQEIARYTAYLCVYFLVIQTLKDRESLNRYTGALLVTGVLISLAALLQLAFGNGKLLWFRALGEGAKPFGPYVNRNHFAGLMEMIIPVGVGMLILRLPGMRNGRDLKGIGSTLFVQRLTNSHVFLPIAVVIMMTSLFLSLSRGGIIGLSLSMALFGSLLAARNSTKKMGRTIVVLFLVVFWTVGWFGWKPVIDRFERLRGTGVSSELRLQNWKDSIGIVRSFPLFGTGLGTYEHVYPRYKTIPGQGLWEHAHNDYLEAAVELGVPGLLLLLFTAGSFYAKMFGMLGKRKSLSSRLLGAGAMAGVTGIVIHSLTDFNLHVGANGLYFCFLIGYAIAVAHVRMDQAGGTLLETRTIELPPKGGVPALTGAVVLFGMLSAIPLCNAGAEVYMALAGGRLDEGSAVEEKSGMLRRAGALSPWDARVPFAEGILAYTVGRKTEATGRFERAVTLDPLDAYYLQMLGIALGDAGKEGDAERYMKLAAVYNPTSASIHKNYAFWFFSRGNTEIALEEMKKAIALDPPHTRKYIVALSLSRVSPEKMRAAIPDDPKALLLYGKYREELGESDEALKIYNDALSVMKRSGAVGTEVYHMIAAIYEKMGQPEQALAAYEEGAKDSPSDSGLRLGIARLCEKLGIPSRAKEEYERVLAGDPMNEYAQRRLKEIRRKESGDISPGLFPGFAP
ncbi:MAG: O-antigen ligase family protein [Nitrospirae bacterium]|nr:O-antigen ligase family protein [Nitrospirota bacterium]